jgi:integrase
VKWQDVASKIGAPGLHFHDLRHTGNHFAAATHASLRDLMNRMGHDSMRAALIYQHNTRGADEAIAAAVDAQVRTTQGRSTRAEGDAAGLREDGGPSLSVVR